MVTIGQLTLATAEAFGIAHGTVTIVARYLRDAGLLTSGGRGPSAAAMSPHDMARLLIAFLAIDRSEPRLAPDAVQYYAGLPYCGLHRDTPLKKGALNFVREFGLPEDHTFEDAVAKLLQIYGNKEMGERLAAHAWGHDDRVPDGYLPVLKVTVGDNLLNAAIHLDGFQYIYSDLRGFEIVTGAAKARQDEPRYQALLRLVANRPHGGMRTDRWFTWTEVNKLLVQLYTLANQHAAAERAAAKPAKPLRKRSGK